MTKYIIFDSGALINLTTNGLTEIFQKLSTSFQGDFVITDAVKYETIEHPMQIQKYEWGAIRIEHLLEDETIRLAEEEEDLATKKEIADKTVEIMNDANNFLFSEGKSIHLIERGESECLALSSILNKRGIANVVVIDERTARMICESPENLKQLMEEKLHIKIEADFDRIKEFRNIKVIRSTELMYMANKKNILDGDKRVLEAVLYALKFGGCSISEKEVQSMKNG